MKVLVDDANWRITTTDDYYFRGDNAFYEITQKVGDTMVVNITIGAQSYQASTDAKYLKIVVSDMLYKSANGEVAVRIAYANGQTAWIAEDVKKVFGGRTLNGRTHGATTDIQIPILPTIAPTPIEVFALGYCVISNGHSDIVASNMGIYQLTTPATRGDFEISVNYNSYHVIGRIGEMKRAQTHKIRVRRACVDAGGVIVQYTDADGCRRYAIGKVMEEATNAEMLEYVNNDSEVANIPDRKVIGGNSTIRIGFPKVPRGQYIEDILTSDKVLMSDASLLTTIDVIPTSSTISRSGDFEDVYVTFKMMQL